MRLLPGFLLFCSIGLSSAAFHVDLYEIGARPRQLGKFPPRWIDVLSHVTLRGCELSRHGSLAAILTQLSFPIFSYH